MSDKIRRRRLELGLTYEEVAKKVGVGKSTVRKWELGHIKNMKRDKIALLAEALELTPAYLMGWEEQPGEFEEKIDFTENLADLLYEFDTKKYLVDFISEIIDLKENEISLLKPMVEAIKVNRELKD